MDADLGALFDSATAGFGNGQTSGDNISNATLDLDAGVAAVLAEEELIELLPTAEPTPLAPRTATAEETQIVLSEVESGDANSGDVHDLDDLFVELIEE